jgi:hypothetical protein
MTPRPRLVLGLWPFAIGAVWVNLFFLSLIGTWLGWPAIAPARALLWSVPLGLPAAWAFARHLERLMAEADGTRAE